MAKVCKPHATKWAPLETKNLSNFRGAIGLSQVSSGTNVGGLGAFAGPAFDLKRD